MCGPMYRTIWDKSLHPSARRKKIDSLWSGPVVSRPQSCREKRRMGQNCSCDMCKPCLLQCVNQSTGTTYQQTADSSQLNIVFLCLGCCRTNNTAEHRCPCPCYKSMCQRSSHLSNDSVTEALTGVTETLCGSNIVGPRHLAKKL